jgi:hypothetical protein
MWVSALQMGRRRFGSAQPRRKRSARRGHLYPFDLNANTITVRSGIARPNQDQHRSARQPGFNKSVLALADRSHPPAMIVRRPSGFIAPCQPSKAARPPSGPLCVHEIKHDGYRLMVRRDGCRRGGTKKKPPLKLGKRRLNLVAGLL